MVVPFPNLSMHWLAQALPIPIFEESHDGTLLANDAARELLKEGKNPRSMAEAAALLTGVSTESPTLRSILSAGRQRKRHAGWLEHLSQKVRLSWHVLTVPTEHGWQLWLLPPHLKHAAQLQTRAALADTTLNVLHEINNALTAIMGWAELGARVPELPPQAKEAYRQIETGVQAARTMTHAILDVSSHRAHASTTLDVSEALHQLIALLQPSARRAQVTLIEHIEEGLHLRAARADLWTSVWNIAKNGIEALPPAGTLRLSAKAMDGQVVISITDDGPGMSAEVQHAIFSPYFTTKEGGTGLGLGLVQKAVQRMQGELKVSSTPGHGSSFHIELPCPVEELAGTASGIRCSFVPLEAHLLLVEDDTSLGEMIVTAMSLQGARVTFVKTAQEALALDEPFDLALLDLLLPDMRGDHLLHELRQKRMITKAILLSGDAPPKDIHPEAMPQMWLQKPFELDTLIHAIRQQLGMAELEPTGQRRRPRHG